MNKKILTICLLTALILVLTCFASCKNEAETADKLRAINVALMQDYSKVELNVQTHTDEADLNAKYVMTQSGSTTDIAYEVERINTFDVNVAIPSEFISTVKGTAKFDGNSLTFIDGEPLRESMIFVSHVNLTFRLAYFTEIKTGQLGMSAKVVDPQSFLQNENFKCDNMTVKVIMTQASALSSIIVDYEVDSATVTLEYSFAV